MNKSKIAIIVVILIIIILIIIFPKRKNNKINSNDIIYKNSIDIIYNNSVGAREIIDPNTGEVLYVEKEEGDFDAIYEFYKQNPNYRANPPSSDVNNDILY